MMLEQATFDPADRLRAVIDAAGFHEAVFVVEPPPEAPPILWVRQAPLGSPPEAITSTRRGDGWVGGPALGGLDRRDADNLATAARLSECAACVVSGAEPGSMLIDACASSGMGLVDLRAGLSAPRAALAIASALVDHAAFRGASSCRDDREEGVVVRVAAVRPREDGGWAGLEAMLPPSAFVEELRHAEDGTFYLAVRVRSGDDRHCRDALRGYAKSTGTSIGLSDSGSPRAGPSELRELSEHASRSLELGGSLFGGGRLSCYDNAALYLAYVDDGRDEPLLAFSRRTLERLQVHDDESGDGLYRTLEVYFKNDRNARRAAAELGIHRHTLAKRLARVEAVTDYPMDAEGRLGYELALAMRHWTKGRISR